MESREDFDSLILRYLSKETNKEDNAVIMDWLHADEENRKHFESLRDAWRILPVNKTMEKIDVDFEWERFKQTLAAKQAKLVEINNQEEIVSDYISKQPNGKIRVIRIITALAVAASVLLLIGLNTNWFGNNAINNPQIVEEKSTASDSIFSVVHHEKNNSGKEKKILLEDGSEITLWNKSELTYQVPFKSNKRDISIIGKAYFKVAKDASRPFTVYSGDISTTALGTEFTVSGFPKSSQIIITLYEGKVVVKSIAHSTVKLKNDYYLLPGNQLIYNKENHIATLRKTGQKNSAGNQKNNIALDKINRDNPSLPKNNKESWYMFNNQPLAEVIDQLKLMYKVDIIYNNKDIERIYFIGSFDINDSIEGMLNKIALTNNLQVKKEGNKYWLYK